MVKVKKRKKNKLKWQQVVLIILVLLLAIMLVFSRGYRAARRISTPPPAPGKEQAELPVNDESDSGIDSHAKDDRLTANDRSYAYHDGDGHISEHTKKQPYIISMSIPREHLLGFISPESDDDFTLINRAYASRSGMYMRREAYVAFLDMREAALADGITLTILSATRSFDHQKRIWENKWHGRQVLHGNILATDIDNPEERALEILRFSAMPGTSRHHWGTDIDLNSLVNSYFETGSGKMVYEWLTKHAKAFGFCQPYTAHGNHREGGYEEERWHWSYMPIASQFLEAFENRITYDDITGFAGSETASRIRVIERFVMDVNKECQ